MEVDDGCLVGGEGNGYRIALAYLEGGRVGVAAQAIGAARTAYQTAVDYAREREAFGKPIIEHQAITFMLADMATKIETAHQMNLYAARLKDAGEPSLKAASMAKLYATQIAEEVCSDAVQIHGGSGFCHGVVEKLYRDCRIYKIYEGTNEIQKLVIGREILAGR
jgi:alkylation response protein AidB-like acyl-CoA dehydrogenase